MTKGTAVTVDGYKGIIKDSKTSGLGVTKFEIEMIQGPNEGSIIFRRKDQFAEIESSKASNSESEVQNSATIDLDEHDGFDLKDQEESLKAATKTDSAMKEFTVDGKDKPQFSLVPMAALFEVMKVMGFGARKYEQYNFSKGEKNTTYTDAALRHIMKYNMNENLDPETKLHHLAHAISDLMMALDNEIIGSSVDNRNKFYNENHISK